MNDSFPAPVGAKPIREQRHGATPFHTLTWMCTGRAPWCRLLCARCARKVCPNRFCYERPNGISLEAIPLFVPTNSSRRSGLGQSSLLGPTHYPSSSLIAWPESSRAMAHNYFKNELRISVSIGIAYELVTSHWIIILQGRLKDL